MTNSAPPGLAARDAALDILIAVLKRRAPLDAALAEATALSDLAPRDRGFARALVTETLRRLGRVDRIVAPLLDRPLPKTAVAARAMLRLGAVQLLFLQTPAHAAVDASVELAGRRPDTRKFKGLINAVLRRVDREGRDALAALSARDDWPAWLTETWETAYGAAAAAAIAQASGREPPLDVTSKSDPATWTSALNAVLTPTGTLRCAGGGDVAALPGFSQGAWWVQDAAAALPVRALGAGDGARVLDMCAAPGGKTLQLAATGAVVTALDKSESRLARVRENLTRTGLSATLHASDALRFSPADDAFDAALLDAPCTATGTLRRRPDVAWSKSKADIRTLAKLQTRLLAAAARLVRPGGAVVFCTCSLQPEEGAPAIAAAIEAGAPLTWETLEPADLPGVPEQAFAPDGFVRTRPDYWDETGGMDGFFIAKLRRM